MYVCMYVPNVKCKNETYSDNVEPFTSDSKQFG